MAIKRPAIFCKKEFWPAMHKNAQVMGTTYAIPFHNSTPILYYNKTMFDQAGIKTAAPDLGRAAG